MSPFKSQPTAVGKYVLMEQIGSGGMGNVYAGRHRETGQLVAIKLIRDEILEQSNSRYRLVQEFQSASKLDHPNIVRSFELSLDGNTPYLVMEYVLGESLANLVDRQVRIPEAKAVRIIAQIAQGLHYAHKQRVIHRDIKPENIYIRRDGLAKLGDFGLAKDYDNDHDLTRPASGLGTPHFMAPEQYEDAKRVGPVSDVYSLGATLYNAVTGNVPFAGATSLIALNKKIKGDVPSPRELVPTLSQEIDLAIRKAMDPNPARRPSSVLRFIRMLSNKSIWQSLFTKKSESSETERRIELRHLCTLPTICAVDHDYLASISSAELAFPAMIHDIGMKGVGLIIARRFEPGATFAFELPGREGEGESQITIARVQNVRLDSLGHWFHGCRFDTPLSEQDLAKLVQESR